MAWIAAIAGIAGPIIGGMMGQGAASTQASGAQQAAQTAANAQLQGLQFVQQQEAPYSQAGQIALADYMSLLGLPMPAQSAVPQYSMPAASPMGQTGQNPLAGSPAGIIRGIPTNTAASGARPTSGVTQQQPVAPTVGSGMNFDVSKLPGYAFEMQQGQQALGNSAAARGQALSGNTMQGLLQFGQGLASTQFQQYMQQLAGLSNMGQAAASGVANQGANLLSGAGASIASGINNAAGYNAGATANWGNMIQSAFNSPSVQSGMQSLFNNPGSGIASDATYAQNNWIGP